MRITGLVVTMALATMSWAQEPAQPQTAQAEQVQITGRKGSIGNSPTAADMYCSGYITNERVPGDRYVAAGWNSPDQTRYAASTVDRIYLRGRDMKVGDVYTIVRHVKDPNHYEYYHGEKAAITNAGEPYFELGYVKVIDVQRDTAVAMPQLACADFVVGDVAIPFVERQPPVFRVVTLDRYAPPNGKTVGRIIMANEFDSVLGSKYIAYLDLGEDKGIKVGDYLRATRTYAYTYHDPEAGMSLNATVREDTQKTPEKMPPGELSSLPRRTLGDMIVLQVHKRSSTVMILTALEDIHVGDGVELMDVSAAPEVQPLQPASALLGAAPGTTTATSNTPAASGDLTAASPPQISCTASPASVRLGESATINCNATSRENRPVSITFVSNGGKLSSSHNQATLDTTDAGPGPIAVRATVFDDRQLSSTATTTVNVEAPVTATPTAQRMTQLDFKPNSAYVDNRSKAILDDVALKLQQDPTSTAVLYGSADAGEPQRLGAQRADNAKTYLSKSKGIDPQRVQTKPGTQPGRTVDIWTVPAGASAPQ